MNKKIVAFYEWANKNGYTDFPRETRKRFFARPFSHISHETEIHIFDSNDIFHDHHPYCTVSSPAGAKIILRELNKKAATLPTVNDEDQP